MAEGKNCFMHQLFSTPVYESKINQVTFYLESLLGENIKTCEPNGNDLLEWSKRDDVLLTNELSAIKVEVESHISHYLFNILQLDESKLKPKHLSSWIVVNPPGSKHDKHVHNNSFVSGVLYLHAPKHSGNLVISQPQSVSTWYSSAVRPEPLQYNEYNFTRREFLAEKYKILLFPGHTQHEVLENKTNENRIAISFNYFIEGTVNDLHGNRMKIKFDE